MTPIKIILIVLLLLVLRAFIVQQSMALLKRVLATIVFMVLVLMVIFPEFSTKIAKLIGVGRGVDLIFYFSHLFLLLLIIALWRRTIVLTNAITKLSRAIAIQNPVKKQDD